MQNQEPLTREEAVVLLDVINRAISYRLETATRMSDIHPLRRAKKKLELEQYEPKQTGRDAT